MELMYVLIYFIIGFIAVWLTGTKETSLAAIIVLFYPVFLLGYILLYISKGIDYVYSKVKQAINKRKEK